jgi:hypothetical protein
MSRSGRKRRLLAGPLLLATAAGLALPAAPAVAGPSSGRTTMDVVCDGDTVTVTAAPGNHGNNWGAVQVDGGGALVLVSLRYAVYDDTTQQYLEDETIDHGLAHADQPTIECTVAREPARPGDLLDGAGLPPGAAGADDHVTSSLTVVVVPRPPADGEQ